MYSGMEQCLRVFNDRNICLNAVRNCVLMSSVGFYQLPKELERASRDKIPHRFESCGK